MSIALPLVDLTSASVGSSGTIQFQNVGIGQGGVSANPAFLAKPAHLNVFNDSKNTLLIQFITEGDSDNLSPGAWRTYSLIPGEAGLTWKVLGQMNVNAPISQLACTYYAPGEAIDNPGVLGNSPIGGSIATTSIQTLSQEGQPKTLLTIDIGDSVLANLININNDGTATLKVDVAGVAHTVLQILNAANFLKLGQTSDTVEVVGQLLVDQIAQLIAPVTSVAGSVGGTINFYTPIWGTSISLKIFGAILSAYNSANVASFTFPSIINQLLFGWAGNFGSGTPNCSMFRSGSAANIQILTALASTGGTLSAATTLIKQACIFIGNGAQTYDQFQMGTTNATAISTGVLVVGL